MDDVSEQFLRALSALEHVADEVTFEEAAATFDDAALQVFWRKWPPLGSWAGALWRQLNEDLARPSLALGEPELDEVGGEGG
ncbi:MAG TPA: hypothetical protein VFH23_17840 [Jiangellaceae bacterium]|nr:hypothetical protein [Jiangellaceae bacterium]